MIVNLLYNSPLWVASQAIRTAWQSFDKSDTFVYNASADPDWCKDCPKDGEIIIGEKDKELIDRVGNKYKHSSTIEHLVYTFYIQDISRALLQELARHRITSLTVKSTRYTLKELKKEKSFYRFENNKLYYEKDRAKKYLVFTENQQINNNSIQSLENLRLALQDGISNDIAKYCLPESFKTELVWTINARSLQNFISLRTDKSALWEIRELALMVFENLPEEHKYLFKHCLKLKNKGK